MAFPLLAVLGQAVGMAGQDQGKENRSDLNKRNAYFQYLMSMINPGASPNITRPATTIGSQESPGNLLSLIKMLGEGNSVGDSYSYGGAGTTGSEDTPMGYYDYAANSWSNTGY